MLFRQKYPAPPDLAPLWMASDGEFLTALWFESSRPLPDAPERDLPVFRETRRWLDLYFAGRPPALPPPLRFPGLTPFRADVLAAVQAIPYGQTTSYGAIAAAVARKRGLPAMSARAVGGAVGWNPVCIVVPCHRVVGADGSLTGYGGGLPNKIALLAREGVSLP